MAISPEAVDRFLNRVLAEMPRFKGEKPAVLLDRIYGSTGAEYQEVTKSRPHQLEGVAFALYLRRALLFYWMRLGKSKIALDWAAHLKRSGLATRKTLIVAHQPVGADVWEYQAALHSSLKTVTVRSGPGAAQAFCDALDGDAEQIVASISTLQTLFTDKRLSRKQVPKLYPAFDLLEDAASYFDRIIIDEIHTYAKVYGLQFSIVNALAAECKFRLGLTGTPIGRKAFKLWPQAYLIDGGKTFGYQYRFFEGVFRKRRGRSNAGAEFDKEKLPIFQYKLDSLALTYGKDEVRTAKVFEGMIKLRMSKEQRSAYNALIATMLKLRVDDTAEVENIFVRCRQIASGFLPFVDEDGHKRMLHFKDSPKLKWLREIFIEELPPDAPCLIFHEFIHTGELICAAFTDAGIPHAWIHGQSPEKNRAELARFKAGKARVLVANTATGGTAIDLPEVEYMCFFESPCSPITRAQAQARPMARALNRPLAIDDLICAPIEEKILSFIAEGNDLSHTLLRGDRKALADLLRAI